MTLYSFYSKKRFLHPRSLHREPVKLHREPVKLHREPVPLHRELVPLHREPVFQPIKKEEVTAPSLPEEDENNDGINDSDSDGDDDPLPATPILNIVTLASIRSSTATNGSTWQFTQLEARFDPDQS